MTYTAFTDDREKMIDFYTLSKDEFLQSYSYLTEEEYMLTLAEVLDGVAYGYDPYEYWNAVDSHEDNVKSIRALLDQPETEAYESFFEWYGEFLEDLDKDSDEYIRLSHILTLL